MSGELVRLGLGGSTEIVAWGPPPSRQHLASLVFKVIHAHEPIVFEHLRDDVLPHFREIEPSHPGLLDLDDIRSVTNLTLARQIERARELAQAVSPLRPYTLAQLISDSRDSPKDSPPGRALAALNRWTSFWGGLHATVFLDLAVRALSLWASDPKALEALDLPLWVSGQLFPNRVPKPISWDPSREVKGTFMKRVEEHVRSQTVDPIPGYLEAAPAIEASAIDGQLRWFLEVRVRGLSIGRVASASRTSKSVVWKAVAGIEHILELPPRKHDLGGRPATRNRSH